MNITELAIYKKMFGGGTGGGGSVEGTAIPVGEKVEKIYINYRLSYSEIKNYLSQLTYVDIGIGVPMSLIYIQTDDGETGAFIFATEINGVYSVAICSSIGMSDLTDVCTNVEVTTSTNIGPSHNIYLVETSNHTSQIEFTELDAMALTEFMGIPVGAENEKIKNVLSITPFTA